ncbi:nuclear transport factor 2 family protein [Amycolatopsis rubida]|uniref:Nuclear transport factor 2 family protein n=1 Tax=Amycolatopsis rubida TaxID=112413 RepID=A0ABX0C598_9PSEU|nr:MULTISPECIES: nuclear transport factor 2 family protein [Amycolatopsis]MYW97962.1 nuclear transport factor 2 family protein [Amycolatopsis rubida]NEC62947.1 nuclear transport factor 2 family protein [Amycolatopsis rubida]OAP22615.1 Ring hydroxylating beta subunit [Amycolatopsis sp. M39]
MTAQSEAPVADETFHRIYAEVLQFYARTMQLLDAGRAADWAESFTEDATFAMPSRPQPVRGRDELTAVAREGAAGLAKAGEVHRHWHSMVSVEPGSDATLAVRCYAQVVATKLGGSSRLHRICVCEDVLVRGGDGRLRVRSRRVTRDDLA